MVLDAGVRAVESIQEGVLTDRSGASRGRSGAWDQSVC
jgi:hypothetical protein